MKVRRVIAMLTVFGTVFLALVLGGCQPTTPITDTPVTNLNTA